MALVSVRLLDLVLVRRGLLQMGVVALMRRNMMDCRLLLMPLRLSLILLRSHVLDVLLVTLYR